MRDARIRCTATSSGRVRLVLHRRAPAWFPVRARARPTPRSRPRDRGDVSLEPQRRVASCQIRVCPARRADLGTPGAVRLEQDDLVRLLEPQPVRAADRRVEDVGRGLATPKSSRPSNWSRRTTPSSSPDQLIDTIRRSAETSTPSGAPSSAGHHTVKSTCVPRPRAATASRPPRAAAGRTAAGVRRARRPPRRSRTSRPPPRARAVWPAARAGRRRPRARPGGAATRRRRRGCGRPAGEPDPCCAGSGAGRAATRSITAVARRSRRRGGSTARPSAPGRAPARRASPQPPCVTSLSARPSVQRRPAASQRPVQPGLHRAARPPEDRDRLGLVEVEQVAAGHHLPLRPARAGPGHAPAVPVAPPTATRRPGRPAGSGAAARSAPTRRRSRAARRPDERCALRVSLATIRSSHGRNGAPARKPSSAAYALTNASCTTSSASAPAPSRAAVRTATGA